MGRIYAAKTNHITNLVGFQMDKTVFSWKVADCIGKKQKYSRIIISNNPLKKMQSLIVIACKILRVIYTILKTGTTYDPQKLLKDIKRPVEAQAPMAA